MAGLEDLYREIILDHYRSPRNKGELETPPAHKVEGFNPLCGDEIVVYVQTDDDERIVDIKIGGQGCSISQSSASMMSGAVKGKTIDEAREVMFAFKGMMNLHETRIGRDDGGDESETDQDGAAEPVETIATAKLKLGDLEALKGVVKFPVRIKCATLSWNTLDQVFEEIQAQ